MNDFHRFRDIPIRSATKNAYREMEYLGLSIADASTVLEEGYDCGMKLRKNIVERCARRNGKILKVVVEKIISQRGIPYWRIRHVGILSKR